MKNTSNKNYFIPKHIENYDCKIKYRVPLASQFFKLGKEFKNMAKLEIEEKNRIIKSSKYIIPSVIMFCTSFEAFMNDTLESSTIINDIPEHHLEGMFERISDIRKEGVFNKKVKKFYKGYDENRIGIDTNGSIYKNLVALFKLRNAFIHYNPETIEHYKWPSKLIEAYKVLKIEKKEYNTNWVYEFCTIKIADWAENTIKSSIYEFCTKANSVNPFELPYPFNWDEESKTED